MAENTTQVMGQENMIELFYNTWGSWGQFSVALAVLKDGTVVDPRTIKYPWKEGVEKEITLQNGVKIIAVQNDSRKNAHRTVKIPKDAVLVVYYMTKTSSNNNNSVEIISSDVADAQLKAKEEVEVKEEGNKKIRNIYEVTYIIIQLKDGRTVEAPVEKKYVKTESELIGKPVVTLTVLSNEIVATGDTYHVRDILKQLGFRWNSGSKTWTRPAAGSDINEIIQKLSEKAEVNVKKF